MVESLTLDQLLVFMDHLDKSIMLLPNLVFGVSHNLLLKKEKREILDAIVLPLLLVQE